MRYKEINSPVSGLTRHHPAILSPFRIQLPGAGLGQNGSIHKYKTNKQTKKKRQDAQTSEVSPCGPAGIPDTPPAAAAAVPTQEEQLFSRKNPPARSWRARLAPRTRPAAASGPESGDKRKAPAPKTSKPTSGKGAVETRCRARRQRHAAPGASLKQRASPLGKGDSRRRTQARNVQKKKSGLSWCKCNFFCL